MVCKHCQNWAFDYRMFFISRVSIYTVDKCFLESAFVLEGGFLEAGAATSELCSVFCRVGQL